MGTIAPPAELAIDGDEAAVRQALHQVTGQTAAAASGINRALVPANCQAIENLLSPARLRPRDFVVRRCIPFRHAV